MEAKRSAILVTLNRLGSQIKNLQQKADFYQELAARESWTALQLGKALKSQVAGAEAVEQIMIDRTVNQMDSDFSFSGEMWNEPLPSLCIRKHPQ